MKSADNVRTAEEQAEIAVCEFLEVRAAILGRLSSEALRCVPAIFERHAEERKEVKNSRRGEKGSICDDVRK